MPTQRGTEVQGGRRDRHLSELLFAWGHPGGEPQLDWVRLQWIASHSPTAGGCTGAVTRRGPLVHSDACAGDLELRSLVDSLAPAAPLPLGTHADWVPIGRIRPREGPNRGQNRAIWSSPRLGGGTFRDIHSVSLPSQSLHVVIPPTRSPPPRMGEGKSGHRSEANPHWSRRLPGAPHATTPVESSRPSPPLPRLRAAGPGGAGARAELSPPGVAEMPANTKPRVRLQHRLPRGALRAAHPPPARPRRSDIDIRQEGTEGPSEAPRRRTGASAGGRARSRSRSRGAPVTRRGWVRGRCRAGIGGAAGGLPLAAHRGAVRARAQTLQNAAGASSSRAQTPLHLPRGGSASKLAGHSSPQDLLLAPSLSYGWRYWKAPPLSITDNLASRVPLSPQGVPVHSSSAP
eukprot:scaffold4272_cov370-Prasinococcus_capsulatus_cf.AAC.5